MSREEASSDPLDDDIAPLGNHQRRWLTFHLRDAAEQLASTMAKIERNPEYSLIEFEIEMNYAYHHLNTARNSRAASPSEIDDSSEETFHRWRQLPSDLDMI